MKVAVKRGATDEEVTKVIADSGKLEEFSVLIKPQHP
jgi:hypothetical protein